MPCYHRLSRSKIAPAPKWGYAGLARRYESYPLASALPDPKHDMALELAVGSRSRYIVSYNRRTLRLPPALESGY